MSRHMTPRQRIRAALHGDMPDQVPFTMYWLMLPRGERERRLRSAGLAVVERFPLYWEEHPHCDLISSEYREDGIRTVRDTIRTPAGEVTCVRKLGLAYNSRMYVEHYLKRPADYRVMEFYVNDAVFHPDYEAYYLAQERLGEDGYALPGMGYSPLMQIMEFWAGIPAFSLALADCPDELFSLYEALRRRDRELYHLYAASPAEAVLYCGNIVGNVVGLRRFGRYILPCLDEFADHLHEAGKLAGCHLDASMRNLAPAIAGSRIDIVEAFTPAPDCDMTVADARRLWPDKILWCNFPSSLHLSDDDTIAATTREMLHEAAPGARFLLGVTEDIPETHMWRSLHAIAGVLNAEGHLPL
jgi:hypothetical protein